MFQPLKHPGVGIAVDDPACGLKDRAGVGATVVDLAQQDGKLLFEFGSSRGISVIPEGGPSNPGLPS